MWGPGFETVDKKPNGQMETHPETIARFFEEEVKVKQGRIFIPEDLESSRLAVVRISPAENQAWVHAYPVPVSEDFIPQRGSFEDEVGQPRWVDGRKVLNAAGTSNEIVFRTGTYEILRNHLSKFMPDIISTSHFVDSPINLPNWDIYDLMKKGVNQIKALSLLGIDPSPLLRAEVLIRSLQ